MSKKTSEKHTNQEWETPGLTPLQVQGAILQAQGQSVKRTAESVGVSCWTIHSWAKIPQYKALINSFLKDTLTGSKRLALSAQKAALQRLTAIITDPETSDGDAISASKVILNIPCWDEEKIGKDDPADISQDEEYERNKRMQALRDMESLMAVLNKN